MSRLNAVARVEQRNCEWRKILNEPDGLVGVLEDMHYIFTNESIRPSGTAVRIFTYTKYGMSPTGIARRRYFPPTAFKREGGRTNHEIATLDGFVSKSNVPSGLRPPRVLAV